MHLLIFFVPCRRDYQRVLHLDPTCLEARVNLAHCLQVMGKFMQAWHQFTAAITVNPSKSYFIDIFDCVEFMKVSVLLLM